MDISTIDLQLLFGRGVTVKHPLETTIIFKDLLTIVTTNFFEEPFLPISLFMEAGRLLSHLYLQGNNLNPLAFEEKARKEVLLDGFICCRFCCRPSRTEFF